MTPARDFRPPFFQDRGQGIPVIGLPAFPLDHRMFQGQAPLAGFCRWIVTDYRGLKAAPEPGFSAGMDDLAGDLEALMDALGLEQAVLLGVSLGGYVALAAQARIPGRIRGLILADSRSTADDPEMILRRRQTAEELRSRGTACLAERLGLLFGPGTRQNRPDLVETALDYLKEFSAEGLARLALGMAQRPDRTPDLNTIRVPVLVLCGEEDAVSPPDGMRSLAAAIPRSEFYILPGAGHLAVWEQPEAANFHIRRFLESLPA